MKRGRCDFLVILDGALGLLRTRERREERRGDHQRKNLPAPGICADIERLPIYWHGLIRLHAGHALDRS